MFLRLKNAIIPTIRSKGGKRICTTLFNRGQTRFFIVVGGLSALTFLYRCPPARAVITVNYTVGSSLASDPQSALIQGAFQQAANRWTNAFGNTFNFNLSIDFAALGTGILGSTGSSQSLYSYTNYRGALVAGATSADDIAAVTSLPLTSLPILINRTSDRPTGTALEAPYLDNNGSANNTNVRMTNANAKALGLLAATNAARDASITFSSNFRSRFDFNPDDGIMSGQYDFVGIATHEIGHALGFVSGVDSLDGNGTGTLSSNQLFATPVDTFRFSSQSTAAGNAIDFTADTRDKYFSLDRGATKIASFSTGVTYGDGRQNSHWKDNLGIGIMDPTAGFGELLRISNTDLRLYDVIGYRLNPQDTPEPASLGFCTVAGIGWAGLRSFRRRQRLAHKMQPTPPKAS